MELDFQGFLRVMIDDIRAEGETGDLVLVCCPVDVEILRPLVAPLYLALRPWLFMRSGDAKLVTVEWAREWLDRPLLENQ